MPPTRPGPARTATPATRPGRAPGRRATVSRAPTRRIALAGATLATALAPAAAGAAALPTAPVGAVQVSVTTSTGWTVEERGPKGPKDQRTTQLVVKRPGGEVDALLYPEAQIPDLCDATSTGFHCLPLRAIFVQPVKVGEQGLLVQDQDGDGTPEIAIGMFSGGAHCCTTEVGYWRDASGTWKSDLTNGGSAGADVSDAKGRLQIANPGFEAMSWSYAASQPFYTWTRLVPGTGWVDASTRADHRKQVERMNAVVRRFAKVRDAAEPIQAARAVRVGHRKALGQKARVASERRTYRRAYGRADARALDRVLKTVDVVR